MTEHGASLEDTPWWVVAIDGVATTEPMPTVRFDAGHVMGRGPVNRYRGACVVEGDRVTVGAVMSTMMAGPEPAMEQERRWFRALSVPATVRRAAEGFELVHDDGTTTSLRSALVTVRGTVTYLARIAMLPGSVVTVRLDDVSRADAPAEPVSEQTVVEPGNVPIDFAFVVDTTKIAPGARLALRASIATDGVVRFTTDEHHPVDLAEPRDHELVLRPVPG